MPLLQPRAPWPLYSAPLEKRAGVLPPDLEYIASPHRRRCGLLWPIFSIPKGHACSLGLAHNDFRSARKEEAPRPGLSSHARVAQQPRCSRRLKRSNLLQRHGAMYAIAIESGSTSDASLQQRPLFQRPPGVTTPSRGSP
jgi:hypothetical protein